MTELHSLEQDLIIHYLELIRNNIASGVIIAKESSVGNSLLNVIFGETRVLKYAEKGLLKRSIFLKCVYENLNHIVDNTPFDFDPIMNVKEYSKIFLIPLAKNEIKDINEMISCLGG